MRIAFFGGTFDPIHRGHVLLARVAADCFGLDEVLFAPADVPPHKRHIQRTPFAHRFAMVALATASHPRMVPSLIDQRRPGDDAPAYSLHTVRRLKQALPPDDRLFFLMGADSLLTVAQWHRAEALLDECDFIVVSRPRFPMDDLRAALPPAHRPTGAALAEAAQSRREARSPALDAPLTVSTLPLRRTRLHLLEGVGEPASSTNIRGEGPALHGHELDPAVAEYIRKCGLYGPGTAEESHG